MSGYFFSNLGGHEVTIFPTDIAQNKELSEVGRNLHFWLAYTFLAFVILHSLDQWKYLRAQVRRFSQAALGVISR